MNTITLRTEFDYVPQRIETITVCKTRIVGLNLQQNTEHPEKSRFGVYIDGISGYINVDAESYRRAKDALNANT